MLTLGVTDVSRARSFYEAMGWRGQEVQETVFFQAGGLALVLWGMDKLAKDTGTGTSSPPAGFRGMSLAHNVRSKADVDSVMAAAEAAGAAVTRAPAETFYGGYAGYFTDPDGHAWEIAYNPRLAPRRRRHDHRSRLRGVDAPAPGARPASNNAVHLAGGAVGHGLQWSVNVLAADSA